MSRKAAKTVDTMLESIMIRLLREVESDDELATITDLLESHIFKRMLQKYVEGVVQFYADSEEDINPNNNLDEINVESFIGSVGSDPKLSKLYQVLMMVARKELSQSSVADDLVSSLEESIMNVPRCMVMTAYYRNDDLNEPINTNVQDIMHDRMVFFAYVNDSDFSQGLEAVIRANYEIDVTPVPQIEG